MNNNQSFAILAIVAFSIIISLLLIPAQSDDTIFFIKEDNSGPPTACTGNLGLVLAQNLTDLCDVTIINATSGQFIEYNGTQWVNIDVTIGTGNSTVLEDLGDVCENVSPTFDFAFFRFDPNDSCWRDMSASLDDLSDVSAPNPTQGDVLTWDTTGFSAWKDLPNTDTTQCINVGGGILLIKNSTSGICYVKSLVAGSGITISNSTDTITITNSAPDNTVCANVGSGTQVYKDGECNFKTLVGSPDISITNTTNTVVIDYNGTAVTSVDATSPIVSSGGTTPTISCSTCVTTSNTWIILANITASGGATSMSSGTITAYKYYEINVHIVTQTSTSVWGLRFNSDSGTNYDCRGSSNNGADSTSTGLTTTNTIESIANGASGKYWFHIDDFSANQKLVNYNIVESVANGSAPDRRDGACHWSNTSNAITTIEFIRSTGTGTLTSASNMVILGHN